LAPCAAYSGLFAVFLDHNRVWRSSKKNNFLQKNVLLKPAGSFFAFRLYSNDGSAGAAAAGGAGSTGGSAGAAGAP